MKKLLFDQRNSRSHWVGDGFPVRTIFSYNDLARETTPFLLMDYAGPAQFTPTEHIRGVGEHPHRGFETVTIVYDGEVEHRDSAGGGGLIGPGDVQWMTAASGVVHEEMHGKDFAKRGGAFEMVQLWVNLPAKDKMGKPRYQGIRSSDIPQIKLKEDAGTLRVIAGEFENRRGPAKTFTPINLWDVRLNGKASPLRLESKIGHTTMVFVLSGKIQLGSGETLSSAELGVLSADKSDYTIIATDGKEAKVLILSGEPINEPVIGYGPFVMNTQAEIAKAYEDYHSGRMGKLS